MVLQKQNLLSSNFSFYQIQEVQKIKYKEIYMTLDNEDYSFKLDIDNMVSLKQAWRIHGKTDISIYFIPLPYLTPLQVWRLLITLQLIMIIKQN